jgi:hypothetical protein
MEQLKSLTRVQIVEQRAAFDQAQFLLENLWIAECFKSKIVDARGA